MNLIVAADKNWAIGKNGQLLVAIPADQKLFREETLNKVIVMGRKTLESLRAVSHYMEGSMWYFPGIRIIRRRVPLSATV